MGEVSVYGYGGAEARNLAGIENGTTAYSVEGYLTLLRAYLR